MKQAAILLTVFVLNLMLANPANADIVDDLKFQLDRVEDARLNLDQENRTLRAYLPRHEDIIRYSRDGDELKQSIEELFDYILNWAAAMDRLEKEFTKITSVLEKSGGTPPATEAAADDLVQELIQVIRDLAGTAQDASNLFREIHRVESHLITRVGSDSDAIRAVDDILTALSSTQTRTQELSTNFRNLAKTIETSYEEAKKSAVATPDPKDATTQSKPKKSGPKKDVRVKPKKTPTARSRADLR